MNREFCAFDGTKKLIDGDLLNVAAHVQAYRAEQPDALVTIFDKHTSRITDVLLEGSHEDVEAWIRQHVPDALASAPVRGRPKLGVVSREVTLLPRQWDWLASQQGGASVTLRKLVDAAAKDPAAIKRSAQDATYRFITEVAGDAPGFEEAMRALYADDADTFTSLVNAWPKDVCEHTLELAKEAFSES